MKIVVPINLSIAPSLHFCWIVGNKADLKWWHTFRKKVCLKSYINSKWQTKRGVTLEVARAHPIYASYISLSLFHTHKHSLTLTHSLTHSHFLVSFLSLSSSLSFIYTQTYFSFHLCLYQTHCLLSLTFWTSTNRHKHWIESFINHISETRNTNVITLKTFLEMT